MAIKQRKQLTGTTAQINAYAGVEGQLVWDKTKKKWVGMSGTAGTNYPMASESHTHSISNVTNLQSALDGKQPKGSYATSKALTDGLAGKANASHTHTIANVTGLQAALDGKQPKGSYATTTALTDGLAGKANSAHTHVIANVTGLQVALDGKLGATAKAASARVADSANSVDWNNVSNKPTIPSSEGVYVTESGSSGESWWRKWSNGIIEQKIYLKIQSWSRHEFSVVKPLTTLLSSCVSARYTFLKQNTTDMHSHFVNRIGTAYSISPFNKNVDITSLANISYDIYILGS